MELRREPMPPPLDSVVVTRLAELADNLDGAVPGQRDDELAEFNRLAGTDKLLADFQGTFKSENPEDFVRRVLFQRALVPDSSISLAEMTEIASRVMEYADDHDFYLELFLVNCKHPSRTDLIYWPDLAPELPRDREPKAAEVSKLALQEHVSHSPCTKKADQNRTKDNTHANRTADAALHPHARRRYRRAGRRQGGRREGAQEIPGRLELRVRRGGGQGAAGC